MDHIRRILNKCNISTAELEQLSTDRDTWKSACANGLAIYNVSVDQAAEDRRTRRHNPPNPPTTSPRCPQCSRICASEFGLRSHLRSHASRPHQQVSNSTDCCKQASSSNSCCRTSVKLLATLSFQRTTRAQEQWAAVTQDCGLHTRRVASQQPKPQFCRPQ